MEIDWSEAPNLATHCIDGSFTFWSAGTEYTWEFDEWVKNANQWSLEKYAKKDIFEIIERPDEWQEGEERMNNIGQNGNDGHYGEVVKQERYKKADGMDKIDEWARDKTHDQFRTIMWAMCEKYESRLGKKDAIVKEVGKMADYMHRWSLYEQQWAGEE